MLPTTTKQWVVTDPLSSPKLHFESDAKIPDVGDYGVLVKFHCASLNFRDVLIVQGMYKHFPISSRFIAGSDGSGTVLSTGSRVMRFKPGDRVVTLFSQAWLGGRLTPRNLATCLGGDVDGVMTQYGVFNENGLSPLPDSLSWEEGATLSCAGLTAWNALFGLKRVMPGDFVLTQGTGGVSIFALQFAVAAGAKVIATTSSPEKAEVLKKLGAQHVLNYKSDPDWGSTAKKLTPGGLGFQHVVDVAGPTTLSQSLKAIAFGGVISSIGGVGGGLGDRSIPQPLMLDAWANTCVVHGVVVGNRVQFEEMIRAIEANEIKPLVDKKVFRLEEFDKALGYLSEGKHVGKVIVKID